MSIILACFICFAVGFAFSVSKAAKQADEAIQRHREQGDPFGVVTHDPEPTAEDLEIPTFLRYQGDDK